jgi:hypothetical protein
MMLTLIVLHGVRVLSVTPLNPQALLIMHNVGCVWGLCAPSFLRVRSLHIGRDLVLIIL